MHGLASSDVMDLEVRQLEAFAATARTGTFTAAARELGVGQPAVSQAVRRLEDRLGVVLFDRTGRSVTPTGAAAALLPQAQAALDAHGAVQRTADRLSQGRAGTLRLVSTPGSFGLLRALLDAFATAYPHARIDLVPRPTRGRRDGLRRSEIDLALVRSTRPARGIAYTSAHREPWRVVLASAHPLAGARTPPGPAVLAEWPFASLGAHDASPALAAYRATAQAARLTPRLGPVASTVDDLLAQVAAGQAWTLLTSSNTSALVDGLVAIPAPTVFGHAELWLAHRARPAPLERALLQLATERTGATRTSPVD